METIKKFLDIFSNRLYLYNYCKCNKQFNRLISTTSYTGCLKEGIKKSGCSKHK